MRIKNTWWLTIGMLLFVLIIITSQSCTKTTLDDLIKKGTECDTLFAGTVVCDSTVSPITCDTIANDTIICDLNPPACDTSFTISYLNDILPTIESKCYDCHDAIWSSGFGGNLRLDSYEFFKAKVDDGTLLCAIKWEAQCSGVWMPRLSRGSTERGKKLSDCFILRLELWISQGKENN